MAKKHQYFERWETIQKAKAAVQRNTIKSSIECEHVDLTTPTKPTLSLKLSKPDTTMKNGKNFNWRDTRSEI